MYGLEGQVAIITGAASGIGRGIARRLAAEGCDIAVFDIDAKGAAATRVEITAMGRRCSAYTVDVCRLDEAASAVAAAEVELGPIDILVNNAGVLRMGAVATLSEADWDQSFAINVGGVFRCSKAVLPSMIRRRKGRIINTASWFGKIGKPHFAAYCASKFAVIGLTQSLAMEAAAHGIRVNAVCPGTIVDTAMRAEADAGAMRLGQPTAAERESTIPLGRVGRPDDIARVVAFLASAESAYMTGQAINVTGGLWMS